MELIGWLSPDGNPIIAEDTPDGGRTRIEYPRLRLHDGVIQWPANTYRWPEALPANSPRLIAVPAVTIRRDAAGRLTNPARRRCFDDGSLSVDKATHAVDALSAGLAEAIAALEFLREEQRIITEARQQVRADLEPGIYTMHDNDDTDCIVVVTEDGRLIRGATPNQAVVDWTLDYSQPGENPPPLRDRCAFEMVQGGRIDLICGKGELE